MPDVEDFDFNLADYIVSDEMLKEHQAKAREAQGAARQARAVKRQATREAAGRARETKVERPRKPKKCFIMVPLTWISLLDKSRRLSTPKVLFYLLEQEFKQRGKGQPIPVSTVALAERGVTRLGKEEALKELETLGFCTIERRLNRCPLVSLSQTRM